jgi:toxin ParE1/3/4
LPISRPRRPRRLRVSDPARRDLEGIGDYTRREWGARQKRKYLGQIRDAFRMLRDSPGIGTPRDDIVAGLRAHPVGRHVVFFRESGDAVVIVRVLHESMDVKARLKGE